jgi:hypothetical protein
MGFNSWARFECDLNQTLFTTTADAMVKSGLLINLDDCWMASQRAANGTYGSGNTWESITNYGQEVLLAHYQKSGYFNDPDFIIPD